MYCLYFDSVVQFQHLELRLDDCIFYEAQNYRYGESYQYTVHVSFSVGGMLVFQWDKERLSSNCQVPHVLCVNRAGLQDKVCL